MKLHVCDDNPGGYGVIACFCAELRAAFRYLGWKIGKKNPDLVVAPLLFPKKKIEAPTCLMLFDHPLSDRGHSIASLQRLKPHHKVACIDRAHVEEVPRYYETEKAFFVPHAGSLIAGIGEAAAQRETDIIFAGNNWPAPPCDQNRLQNLLSGQNLPYYPHIKDDPSQFIGLDGHLRHIRRHSVLNALQNIDIYGCGWKGFTQHTLHGEILFSDLLLKFQQAKIVLNISPNFHYAAHERALSAMMAGALVVTDRNHFWEEHFVDGEEIILYDYADLSSLKSQIKELLADDDRRIAIAKRAQEKALDSHTWVDRAKKIAAIYE